MERLDFCLHDFVRVSWVSESAKNLWQPRFRRIAKAWNEIEWLSIVAGARSCCLTEVPPDEYPLKAREWLQHGLTSLPLELQGVAKYSYASTPARPRLMEPYKFLAVVGSPDSLSAFQFCFDSSNDESVGQLLGYPVCCTKFFHGIWVEQNFIDSTWPMALNSQVYSQRFHRSRQFTGVSETNVLLRWMGIRLVPHLPCSFDCQPTISFAKDLLILGRNAGFSSEMDWLLEILSWPLEWSALHGIAEVKTPVLKLSTRTDATAEKYTVTLEGHVFPDEGARGLHFPYHHHDRKL